MTMISFGIADFGLFCMAVLLLNATPGPDTAFIVGRSVAQGRAAGMVSALGISAGCLIHSVASALGLTAILAASASAFMLVKLAGGAYLIYLGLKMLWARPAIAAQVSLSCEVRPLPTIFWQAVATNLLNPKVILFFLSFFPQFVAHDASHQTLALLLLGVTFVVLSTVWNGAAAFLAGTLSRRAGNNQNVKLWLERTVGAAFIALGAKLVLTKN